MHDIYAIPVTQVPNYDKWLEMVHPEDRIVADVRSMLQEPERRFQDAQFRILLPDGSLRHIHSSGRLQRSIYGEPIRLIGINVDITDRVNAERQRQENEKRYRQMFETNLAVKLIVEPDSGKIMEANPAACRFYGYDAETLTSLHIWDINRMPEQEIRNRIAEARNADRLVFESRHRLANGQIRDVEIYSGPLEQEGRTLVHSIVIDVTERNRMWAALQDSQTRLATAQRIAHIGHWQFDFLNDDFSYSDEIFNILERPIPARHPTFEELLLDVHPEDREKIRNAWNEAIEARKPFDFSHRLVLPDGKIKFVHQNCEITFAEDGRPKVAMGTMQDITRLYETEQELISERHRLATIIEGTNIGTWEWNVESGKVIFNEKYSSMSNN